MYRPFFKTRIPELGTNELLLRAFAPFDAAALHQLLVHPQVGPWLGIEPQWRVADARQWIDGIQFWWDKHGYGLWAIEQCATGDFVGYCGLKFAEDLAAPELMYAISAQQQGRGYATQAAHAALGFGFGVLGLHRIDALTHSENLASQRVLQKCGMAKVGFQIMATHLHVHYSRTNDRA